MPIRRLISARDTKRRSIHENVLHAVDKAKLAKKTNKQMNEKHFSINRGEKKKIRFSHFHWKKKKLLRVFVFLSFCFFSAIIMNRKSTFGLRASSAFFFIHEKRKSIEIAFSDDEKVWSERENAFDIVIGSGWIWWWCDCTSPPPMIDNWHSSNRLIDKLRLLCYITEDEVVHENGKICKIHKRSHQHQHSMRRAFNRTKTTKKPFYWMKIFFSCGKLKESRARDGRSFSMRAREWKWLLEKQFSVEPFSSEKSWWCMRKRAEKVIIARQNDKAKR